MKTKLHDRINSVINTSAFERTLEAAGVYLFDFQSEWSKHDSFEQMPVAFQQAILAGEAELSATTVALA